MTLNDKVRLNEVTSVVLLMETLGMVASSVEIYLA